MALGRWQLPLLRRRLLLRWVARNGVGFRVQPARNGMALILRRPSLSVSVDVVARQRHAAPTTKVWSCRRFWELRCAGGDGAGGWTSGWRGEGPPSDGGQYPDRRAVAHSGLYSGVLSLCVSADVVARQRHAAPTTKVWRCPDFGNCGAPAAMKLADGPCGWRGRGDRGKGSIPDRRAVAHSGLYSGVLSLSVSVDVVARQRHAAPTTKVWSCRRFWELRCAGGDGAGGWTSGWRGASRRVDRPATTQRKSFRIDFKFGCRFRYARGPSAYRDNAVPSSPIGRPSVRIVHPKLKSRPSLRWKS